MEPKYRIVEYNIFHKGSGETLIDYDAQIKTQWWPFWRSLHSNRFIQLREDAENTIKVEKKRRSFNNYKSVIEK